MSKALRESSKEKVMKLITWYEQNKPDAGMRIEVDMPPRKLAKAFGFVITDKKQREFIFRGRTLVAIGVEKERGQSPAH